MRFVLWSGACVWALTSCGGAPAPSAATPSTEPAATGETSPAATPAVQQETATNPEPAAAPAPAAESATPAQASLTKAKLDELYGAFGDVFEKQMHSPGKAVPEVVSAARNILAALGFSSKEQSSVGGEYIPWIPMFPTECNLDADSDRELVVQLSAGEPGDDMPLMGAPPDPSGSLVLVAWLDPAADKLNVVGRRIYRAHGIEPEVEITCAQVHSAHFDDTVIAMSEPMSLSQIVHGLEVVCLDQGKATTIFAGTSFDLFRLEGGVPKTIGYWPNPNEDGTTARFDVATHMYK